MDFGIISTANIGVKAVIPAIQASDHEVVAIASRDGERAEAVAADFGIERSYASYEALLADDDLDAVYNPLPNSLHAEWTKRAADHGRHVLCEKPLAVDAAEARDVAEYCAEAGVTLMEAFMYRYHPRTERAAELAESALGDLRHVHATFQFPLRGRPNDVRLNPDLAGGSLMDVGCYTVSAARLFLGEPDRVYANSHDSRDCGVDTQFTGLLEYPDGVTATLTSGFDTQNAQHYRVEGTDGWLEIPDAFNPQGSDRVTLEYATDGRQVEESFEPTDHYRLQVDHFAECVERGVAPRTDSAEAIRNMAVIDALYESVDRGEPVEVEWQSFVDRL